jgi:phage regulator Rha-like protein
MMQIQTIGAARTMSSREIAELTEKEHKHVLRDVRVMLDQLEYKGPGLVHFWTDPQSKRDYHEYLLPEDLTLTLVSGYSVQMRHRIVKRWQELEARNTPVALPDFADPVAAARAWADATESKIKAETALALAAPKVEMVDRYMDATGTQTFRQVAKLLGASWLLAASSTRSAGRGRPTRSIWTPGASWSRRAARTTGTHSARHGSRPRVWRGCLSCGWKRSAAAPEQPEHGIEPAKCGFFYTKTMLDSTIQHGVKLSLKSSTGV